MDFKTILLTHVNIPVWSLLLASFVIHFSHTLIYPTILSLSFLIPFVTFLHSSLDEELSIQMDEVDDKDSDIQIDQVNDKESYIPIDQVNDKEETIHIVKRKLLLILDINGILIHREYQKMPNDWPISIQNKAIKIQQYFLWKRPHLEAFLDFIFEHYTVAVWSCAASHNVIAFTKYIFNDRYKKLLFIWDQKHCTKSIHPDPKEKGRPLFKKQLSRVIENYHEFTLNDILLVDDTPLKTADNAPENIFTPKTWEARMTEDEGLSENGEIRQYLEKQI